MWLGIYILEKCRAHQSWFRRNLAQNLVDIKILSRLYSPGIFKLIQEKIAQNLADIKISPRLYSPCIFFASSFSRVGGMGGWWEANLSNDTHRQPSNQDMENNQKTKIKTKTERYSNCFFFLQWQRIFFFSKPVPESSRQTRSFGISQHIGSFFSPKVRFCAM